MSHKYVKVFCIFKFFWIPGLEFFLEMFFLICHLLMCDCEKGWFEIPIYFFSIKIIISLHSFFVDFSKILIDSIERIFCIFKPFKLRMIFVSFCISWEDIFCKQSLSPESDETFCIEISRMKWPDSHLFRGYSIKFNTILLCFFFCCSNYSIFVMRWSVDGIHF